ncbi:MAG: patatin-like phospholipase family protein [Bacteroidales bacterium]
MKRLTFSILILLLLSIPLHAERKKVGLVLGGGGAKGAAHVGVLKVLEEIGMPIDYIAGTSIGAIVGAFYATGHNADQIDSLMHTLKWNALLTDQMPQNKLFYRTKEREWKYALSIPLEKQIKLPAGIISGQNILNLFSDLTIGYHDTKNFLDLPIPFSCVATDMSQGRSLVLSSGSLPLAMRASMSIPGLFAPVLLDDMVLVDGGVLNNLPTNVVKEMGADITIGINLATPPPTNDELTTFNGMVNKLVDMMGKAEYEKNYAALDLCLQPDLDGFNTLSFNKEAVDSLYQRGIEVARQHMPELLALKKQIYNDTTPDTLFTETQTAIWNPNDSLLINKIRFEGVPEKDAHWFRKKIQIKEASIITVQDINKAIANLDGLDLFSSVTYRVSPQTPGILTFVLKKKALSQVNIGFRFDTESMASILLNTTISQKFMKGSELAATAKLDKNPYLSLEYKWGPGPLNKIGVTYLIGYHNFNLYQHKKRIDNLNFLWQTGEIKYIGAFRNVELQTGLEWDYFGYTNEVYYTQNNPMPKHPGSFVNYFLLLNIASYDNRYYPTYGWMGFAKAKLITDNFIGYHGKSPVGSIEFNFETVIDLGKRFALLPHLSGRLVWGDEIPAIYLNYMGGDINGRYLPQQIAFPGIRNIQLFDNVVVTGKLALRYQLQKKHYLFLLGCFGKDAPKIATIVEGSNIWSAGAKYSYNSPIGPISGEITYSNWTKEVGVYFNLGYYF